MAADSALEKLLEDFDSAQRKRATRLPLIEEALAELPNCEAVALDGYMGFGRTLNVNADVRAALVESAQEEVVALNEAVEAARALVMEHRGRMAALGA